MRIYFARHGESEANRLREFSNRGYKYGLTETGRTQAARLAARLSRERIGRVVSSPLRRAIESAQLVGEILAVAVEQSEALREWDVGVLEGRSDDAAWAEYGRLREAWAEGDHERRIEGGESLVDVKARFAPFVEQLASGLPSDSRVLLIGHGGLYSAALPLVMSGLDPGFAAANGLDNAAYAVGELRGGRLVCTEWAGKLMTSPS